MRMTSRGRKTALLGSAFAGLILLLQISPADAARSSGEIGKDWGDPKGQECVDCHMTENPGLYWEWNHSQHGQNGVNCLDCHAAEEGEVDAYIHDDKKVKKHIATIVSPKDCSSCHEKEVVEKQ